ncbi:MAG: tight adherence protein C, partial [Gammaproteobacteria bacterium]
MDTLLYPTTILSAGLCGFLGLMGFAGLYAMIDQDTREYMDPLSFKMRLIWPFIQIIANFFCVFLPYDYIEYTELRLSRTGVSYLMTAEQFIALRIISAIMVTVFAFILMVSIGKFQPVFLVIAPIVGFFFPDIWLNDTRKAREGAVIRAMPVYLDFITMCVEAGLNLQGALDQAMEKAPPGPLKNEFGIVLRDLRSGLSR